MLIYQNLGVDFCAPESGYQPRKRPVLPPESGKDFTLQHLLRFQICARKICEKFVYKHSDTNIQKQ